MIEHPDFDEQWKRYLTGTDRSMVRGRHMMKFIPSSPRCKMCNAPFGGVGAIPMRLMGRRPATANRHFCNKCELYARDHPGGVEMELTLLFADIRGSTPLAESLGTTGFRHLIDRFFRTANDVLTREDAFVSRLIGDEAVAFFLPAFISGGHARGAVRAARKLLEATGHAEPEGPWAPVGIGLNTGTAFVGAVGTPGGAMDFTALGDEVNTTARLASTAAAGEILLTDATRAAAELPTGGLEPRHLQVKGRIAPVETWVVRVGEPVGAPTGI